MLNVTGRFLDDLLKRIDSLEDPSLRELSDRDAFDFLNRALYLDDERSDKQVSVDVERYSKFNFLTNGGESFDQTKSFIMADAHDLRFLFEDENKGFASARVPREASSRRCVLSLLG